MTPEQWKRFKQLYKKAGDDCWCDELRELAESTALKPKFIVSAYENDIIKL